MLTETKILISLSFIDGTKTQFLSFFYWQGRWVSLAWGYFPSIWGNFSIQTGETFFSAARPHKSQFYENTKRQCFQPCINAGVFCVRRVRRGYYVLLIHDPVRYSLTFTPAFFVGFSPIPTTLMPTFTDKLISGITASNFPVE